MCLIYISYTPAYVHAESVYRTENIEKKSLVDQNLLLSNRISDRIYWTSCIFLNVAIFLNPFWTPEPVFLNTAWAFYDMLRKLHFTYAYPQTPKGSQRPAKAHRGNRVPQRPSRDPTEAQQRPRLAHRVPAEAQVCNLCVFMRFQAYVTYTCSHVQK